jgi:hypothetical protein
VGEFGGGGPHVAVEFDWVNQSPTSASTRQAVEWTEDSDNLHGQKLQSALVISDLWAIF